MTTPIHPQIILSPIRPAASAAGGTLEVLVRVQAPVRPAELGAPARPPLRLALAIDRSGSMSGEPLQEALRCAEYIAGGLGKQDQLAVILYDNAVRVALPLAAAGDPARVRAALAGVDSGGSTALFDGWEAAARALEGGVADAISRVLLLSDGQANQGLCDLAEIQRHCAHAASLGVTTTTVGLGRSFNEELMIGMARSGGGQHYYGQRAEDLHDSFDEELALLQSLFLRRLVLKLVPAPGVLIEPVGDVQPGAEQGTWCLPDLAWDAEAWMMLRLHLSPRPEADPRSPEALFAVTVEGVPDGSAPIQVHGMLTLPRVPESDLQGMPADPAVIQRLQEIEFATATARIHALLSAGDVAQAGKLLKEIEAQFADHPWLREKLAALRELMQQDVALSAKEARYSSMRMARRLAPAREEVYQACEMDASAIPSYLRRKSVEGEGRKRKP